MTRLLVFLLCCNISCIYICAQEKNSQQKVKFAWLADTHISENGNSAEDLRLCVKDINANTKPDFVIIAGDITNFGSDNELRLAKEILDSLTMPYYIVSGNHDAKWSESGCNSFINIFGYEQAEFRAGGYRFLACASGPNMRMAPALLPRSDMVWLSGMNEGEKSIFINHYPIDSSILNYFDIRKELRRLDTRLVLGGHWHKNTILNYDGIPGLLGRSTLSSRKTASGYNLVHLNGDEIRVQERRVYKNSASTLSAWYCESLGKTEEEPMHCDRDGLPDDYPWKRYDINEKYSTVKEAWRIQEDSDIASGFAYDNKKTLFYACCDGTVNAVSTSGKKIWTKKLPGKIFSTPAYSNGILVLGCADNYIYALKASSGRTLWKFKCSKSVLASPVIFDKTIYIGASDSVFRAIDLESGNLLWRYDGVEGFVESKAYADAKQVVFGAWDRKLYSLDRKSGKLMWIWELKKNTNMYSPAACWPVKGNGCIFVATPDRRMYAIDADSGKEIYHCEGGREAIGISPDGEKVFVKTMHNELYAVSTSAKTAGEAEIWRVKSGLGYDIGSSAISADENYVYVPGDKGVLSTYDAHTGEIVWERKLSAALVNPVLPLKDRKGQTYIIASTMDGYVIRINTEAIK